MPALVEVEVIRRDLEKEVVGRRIKEVEIKNNRNAMKVIPKHGRRKEFQELLDGAKIDKIDRAGQRIFMELDTGKVMMVDLGETGQLLKTSASGEIETHTHLVITFTIGGQLRLVDPKPSSEIFVGTPEEIEAQGYRTVEGIDPLEQQVTWPHFSGMLEEREQPMKDLLMDDNFIVGLGNMYTDEILWTAALRYDRPSNKLTSQDVRRLYRALIETLQESLKARGTSLGTTNPFTDLTGVPGQYQLELKVFEREGETCKRCRNIIVKEKYRDGFTYLCPQCQT